MNVRGLAVFSYTPNRDMNVQVSLHRSGPHAMVLRVTGPPHAKRHTLIKYPYKMFWMTHLWLPLDTALSPSRLLLKFMQMNRE